MLLQPLHYAIAMNKTFVVLLSPLMIFHQNLNTHQKEKKKTAKLHIFKILQNVLNTTGSDMYNLKIKPNLTVPEFKYLCGDAKEMMK